MEHVQDATADVTPAVAAAPGPAPAPAGLVGLAAPDFVGPPLTPRNVLALQGRVGNHAVSSLLDGRPPGPPFLARAPAAADAGLGRALADCARSRTAGLMRQTEEEAEGSGSDLI